MATNKVKQATKLRFVALYAVSIVLIFIVITAFWKRGSASLQTSMQASSGEDTYFAQFDTLLHNRLDHLDKEYADYLKKLPGKDAKTDSLVSARKLLTSTLDSIENLSSLLASGAKRDAIQLITTRFRKSLDIREMLMNKFADLPATNVRPAAGGSDSNGTNGAEITNLKTTLNKKEQRIAALENQLKQKDASVNVNAAGSSGNSAEWKQKYTSLKAAYDRMAENEKSLRNAYKTVADDNRRLIGQLQSTKKG